MRPAYQAASTMLAPAHRSTTPPVATSRGRDSMRSRSDGTKLSYPFRMQFTGDAPV